MLLNKNTIILYLHMFNRDKNEKILNFNNVS